jgi:hypothetical protein
LELDLVAGAFSFPTSSVSSAVPLVFARTIYRVKKIVAQKMMREKGILKKEKCARMQIN